MPSKLRPQGRLSLSRFSRFLSRTHQIPGLKQDCFFLLLVLILSLGCSKPPAAPPAAAPPAATASPAKPNTTTEKNPTVATNTPQQPNSYQKMVAEGRVPGTPEFVKKQAELKLEREKQEAVENKAFAEAEEVWLKKVDDESIQIEKVVKDQTPDVFDLKVIGKDPGVKLESDRYAYIYGLRLSEVATYLDLTQDPPAARDPAMKFLQAYVASATNQHQFLDGKELSEFAKAATAAGSVDPLVKLHLAIEVANSMDASTLDQIRDAYDSLIKITPLLDQEKKYPRGFAFQAKLFAAKLGSRLNRAVKTEIHVEVLNSWTDWLIEMSQDSKSLSFAYGRSVSIITPLDVSRQKTIYSAIMKRPGIDPWLVHMIGGLFHHNMGWKFRGGGFASTVSEEGWAKLHEHQTLARRHYLRAYALQPRLPEAPGEMMKIALTNSQEAGTSTEWFLRTVRICFDYRPAYDQLEWSLRPRWGGSIPELLALAKACLDTERFDTFVPSTGLDLLIRVQQNELGLSSSIFDEPNLLPAVIRYADALEEAVKTGSRQWSPNAVYDRSRLAALFVHAGELPRAHQILRSIANQVSPEPFYRLQLRAQYTIGMALAASPELLETVRKLDGIIQNGANSQTKPQDFDESLSLVQTLRKSLNVPEGNDAAKLKRQLDAADWSKPENIVPLKIHSFVLHADTAVGRLREFSSDQWVKLTVDDQASGWEISASKSKCLPPDAIELTCEGDYHIYELRSLARFEPPYDIQVTVESIHPGSGGHIPFTGISLGPTDLWAFVSNKKAVGLRMFGVYPNAVRAAVWQQETTSNNDFLEVPSDKSYIVRVKAWDKGRYQFSVNDLRIVDKTDRKFTPGKDLIFGATISSGMTGTGRLSLMQIRRLAKQPPKDPTDYPAIEAFARSELAFDEEDAMAHFDLGRSLYYQGKYADALKSLDSAFTIQPQIARLGLRTLKAVCHSRLGQFAAAIQEYEFLQRNGFGPNQDVAADELTNDFARILATARDDKLRKGKLSLQLAKVLNEKTKSANWEYLWTLAAAHAECEEFPSASKRMEECLALAPTEKKEFLTHLKQNFDSKKPYRMDK